jgi:hypothetical protein
MNTEAGGEANQTKIHLVQQSQLTKARSQLETQTILGGQEQENKKELCAK